MCEGRETDLSRHTREGTEYDQLGKETSTKLVGSLKIIEKPEEGYKDR